MARQIQLNLQLTPVYRFDSKTDQYTTYYEEFPNAIAVGETEEDAEIRLVHLVETMWKERHDDLRHTLLTKYTNSPQSKIRGEIKIA